jgi:hypothetical protein
MSDDESPSEEGTKDIDDEAGAAHQEGGQDQEPKQAQEESSGLWDTKDHSDAPGPFGTGNTDEGWKSKEDGEDDEDDED